MAKYLKIFIIQQMSFQDMSKDYNKSAQTALRLIKKFGAQSTFTTTTPTAQDPLKPWETSGETTADYPVFSCLINLTSEDIKYFPDLTSVNNMQRSLVDAVNLTITPKIGDKIIHSGSTWIVRAIKPLNPAGVNVFWDMAVGK